MQSDFRKGMIEVSEAMQKEGVRRERGCLEWGPN